MKNCCYYYEVAGHPFKVELPEGFPADAALSSYRPFETEEVEEPLFVLRVNAAGKLPQNPLEERLAYRKNPPSGIWLYRQGRYLAFGFSEYSPEPESLLFVSPSYREGTLHIRADNAPGRWNSWLHNSLMQLYTLNTAGKGTLLVHAAAVEHEGKGYLFLGRSGTGKSTHARLWLERVEGSDLLNDDSPVLRVENDGSMYVYGSPWSGKTACYKNRRVKLEAVVRLSQAPFNRIRKMSLVEAYASLLPSCSSMLWERNIADGAHDSIERVVARCVSYHLECLPDGEAALLCARTVRAI